MTSYDEIEDENELQEMMSKVENFEERKKIRARIREIRDKKMSTEKSASAAAASTPDTKSPSQTSATASGANKENIEKKCDEADMTQKDDKPVDNQEEKKDDETGKTKNDEKSLEETEEKKDDKTDTTNKDDKNPEEPEEKNEVSTEKPKEGEKIEETPEEKNEVSTEKPKEEEKVDEKPEVKKDGAVEKAKDDDQPKETTETTSVTSKDGKTTTVTTVQTITDKNETRIITTEVTTKTMPDGGTSTKTSKRTKIIQNQTGFGGAMATPGGLAPAGRGRGVTRSPSAIKQMLLEWTKAMTQEYSDKVVITNFSSSWNNGLAFCALIHHFYPDAFDFDKLDPKKRRANFDLAFETAEKLADIAPLLDTDDMVKMKNPDWKCVFTYVQSFYKKLQKHERNKAMPKPEKAES